MEPERRQQSFWDRWQTIILLGGMVSGFAGSGAVYFENEGKKEQKLDYLVLQMQDFAATRYTKEDASKDKELETSHYNDVSERLRELEYRANRSENTLHPYPSQIQPSPMPKRVP